MQRNHGNAEHHHDHQGHGGHDHSHGAVDPSLVASKRGMWAVKWSFIGLLITALVQVVVVLLSGSVALLSDTIHNFGDTQPLYHLGLLSRSLGWGQVSAFHLAMGGWKTWPGRL